MRPAASSFHDKQRDLDLSSIAKLVFSNISLELLVKFKETLMQIKEMNLAPEDHTKLLECMI